MCGNEMPKGTVALPLQIPKRGLIRNYRPYELPPDAVSDGQNMMIDRDGLYSTRPGYLAHANPPTGTSRITGGTFFSDIAGTTHTVVATRLKWWELKVGLITPAVDITGTALTNTTGKPNRFIAFPESSTTYLVGTNDVDVPRRWDAIVGGAYTTIAAAPICKDVIALANRVVALNCLEAGTRRIHRVKWTAVNDSSTWPATAVANLSDTDDALIGGYAINRTTAAIFRDRSTWAMIAQAGSDATAFRFEQIESNIGPCSSASVVAYDSMLYYLSSDLKVRRFDGQRSQILSDPVEPVLQSDSSGLDARDGVHGVPFYGYGQIWWFFPSTVGDDAREAIVFHPASGRWEVKQVFGETITASFISENLVANTDDLRTILCTDTSKVHILHESYLDDNGTAISYSWKTGKFSPDSRATYLPNEIEDYFVQQATAGQEVTVKVEGWEQPEELTSTTLIEGIHDLAGTGGVSSNRFQLFPPKDMSQVASARFLQAQYSGSATAKLSWAGGVVYVYPEAN